MRSRVKASALGSGDWSGPDSAAVRRPDTGLAEVRDPHRRVLDHHRGRAQLAAFGSPGGRAVHPDQPASVADQRFSCCTRRSSRRRALWAIWTANVPTPPDAPLIRTCCPGCTRPGPAVPPAGVSISCPAVAATTVPGCAPACLVARSGHRSRPSPSGSMHEPAGTSFPGCLAVAVTVRGTGSGLTCGRHWRSAGGGPRPRRRDRTQKPASAAAPSAATASVVASPLRGSCSS